MFRQIIKCFSTDTVNNPPNRDPKIENNLRNFERNWHKQRVKSIKERMPTNIKVNFVKYYFRGW